MYFKKHLDHTSWGTQSECVSKPQICPLLFKASGNITVVTITVHEKDQ